MVEQDFVAKEMTPFQRLKQQVRRWYLWHISRRLPRLVWYGDEVDVRISFSQDPLPPDLTVDDDAFATLFAGTFAEIEAQFRQVGITFDHGQGLEGRDWEWDWSLSGPINVSFRSRAKKPENRRERPKPKLVYTSPK